jgi:3-oxoacyl-[acyl-carrier-protein] synthase-1
MKRIVITGLGIVSSIGNNSEEVLASLQEGRSGIQSKNHKSGVISSSAITSPLSNSPPVSEICVMRSIINMEVDGKVIYVAKDLRVGLFTNTKDF